MTICNFAIKNDTSLSLGGLADWCQIENGGCEQLCYNKCGRHTSCGCLPGYTLAYDRKTCIGR